MTPRTIELTTAELMSRRATILQSLGMSRERFRERMSEGPLSPTEWDARSEIEQIDFLLGDSPDDV